MNRARRIQGGPPLVNAGAGATRLGYPFDLSGGPNPLAALTDDPALGGRLPLFGFYVTESASGEGR